MHKLFHNFKAASSFAKEQAVYTNLLHTVKRNGENWIVFNKETNFSGRTFQKRQIKHRNYCDNISWNHENVNEEEAKLDRLVRTRKTGLESSWRKPKPQVATIKIIKPKGSHVLCSLCSGDGGINQGCPMCDGTGWKR